MRIFVDFVRATGLYEAAREPSWVDGTAPTALLTAPGFLHAYGINQLAERRRLYHVERGRFVHAPNLDSTRVSELDTIVVINNDDPLFDDPRAVEDLWQVTGGPQRRATPVAVEPSSAQYTH